MRTKSHSSRAKPKNMPSPQPFTGTARTLPPLVSQHEQADSLITIVTETGSDGYEDDGSMGHDRLGKQCGLSPENGVTSRQDCVHLDSLDREECMRCKGKHDGHVLICSEMGCPIAIHEKCMCCKPMFDDFGRFYCPYCSYKRALRWTLAFGRNAKATKKALLDFLGGNKCHQKDGEDDKNEHGAKPLDNCQVEIEKTVVDTGIRVSEKNDPNVDSHAEKGTTADGLVIGLNEGVDDGIRVLEENNGRREDEELILQGLDEPANIYRPIFEVRTRHIKRRAQRTARIENVDSSGGLFPPSRKSSNRPTTIAGATPYKTSLESGKQFTNLNFPNAKRKRLNWTNEEEEILKRKIKTDRKLMKQRTSLGIPCIFLAM